MARSSSPWPKFANHFDLYYGMGEVMHCVVYVMNFVWGFSNLRDAEDASMLCGGLHHFALVTKKIGELAGGGGEEAARASPGTVA